MFSSSPDNRSKLQDSATSMVFGDKLVSKPDAVCVKPRPGHPSKPARPGACVAKTDTVFGWSK